MKKLPNEPIMVPNTSKTKHGFTLIELLTVIAVISILIAVLLPALSAARRLAKRVMCQSQLRQISQAWHMYLDDSDGRFYQSIHASTAYGGWRGTNEALSEETRPLNPYVSLPIDCNDTDQAKLFRCPAEDGGGVSAEPYFNTYGTSYITNNLLVGQGQRGWLLNQEITDGINQQLLGVNRSKVSQPNRVVLIGDFGWADCAESMVPRVGDWHGKRCFHNLAYLDGHVKFVHVRKGLYITDEYVVVPFGALHKLVQETQEEEEELW